VSELRALAERIARAAGQVLVDRFHGARTIEFKGDTGHADFVTDADRASEALILETLAREVPGHAVLAEESGARGQGDWCWYVDPLDGTVNYAHGVPHFSVTLAVSGPSGLEAACTFDPLRGELFSAARGQGASLNGRSIRCSAAAHLDDALMVSGFPYDVRQRAPLVLGLFDRVVVQTQGMRRFGSAALDLAWVAAGRFDGYYEFGLKPWDSAAGALLVAEAGGVVSRIDGAPYEPRWSDVLAAAPGIAGPLGSLCSDFVRGAGWAPR
jgi:myo-inositol-1(or 4)-monophosphatase